jgi:inorganic phosphate transporter, PiT family
MSDLATTAGASPQGGSLLDRKMKRSPAWLSGLIVLIALVGGLGYVGFHIAGDLGNVTLGSAWPYVLLATALLIALAFEFVNGFHDTANAVATCIYTHSLEPNLAVVYSGLCNLIGVLLSSGIVAFTIITLLPVELILKVSSGAGFAMVFALLIAAILWNLGTWWLGLPASSTHTMTGSIIGVGLANQILSTAGSGTSGVDWSQATKVLWTLLISPFVGFICAFLLFLLSKIFIKYPELYQAPKDNTPPPFPIRLLLILTCGGVSYFHGSNDGQKGMGLIMLILIGTVPTAYALNHAMSPHDVQDFLAASQRAVSIIDAHADSSVTVSDPAAELTTFLQTKQFKPATLTALGMQIQNIERSVRPYGDYKNLPAGMQTNVRNGMYLTSETLRLVSKKQLVPFSKDENAALDNYRRRIDNATKFIPNWVKVAVAIALGLGTMVGWKRIVVTVGEKIGKEHLTYAQGASAELVAMGTIFMADYGGLPVSTTHVLSSGVAGTMAANKSGLQLSTIRNIAAAWVFTLPAAALLSGLLFALFRLFAGS